jgi:tetratricopeptide (TPR) repeat protein
MGQLMYELGHLARARRAYYHARSSAKWSGHYAYAGKAHHDLLLVECAVGTYSAGESHARKALELYPRQFPRIPHLAHDFAFLLTCHGAYEDALALLDAALPFFVRSWEKVAILGTIAKAAAATGRRERYAEAVADLLLLGSAAETHSAAALVLAAEGAAMLGDDERARRLAARALELANRRHEREPLRRARQVLDGGGARRVAPPRPEQVAPLRDQFVDRLRGLRASAAGEGAGAELARFTMSGRT